MPSLWDRWKPMIYVYKLYCTPGQSNSKQFRFIKVRTSAGLLCPVRTVRVCNRPRHLKWPPKRARQSCKPAWVSPRYYSCQHATQPCGHSLCPTPYPNLDNPKSCSSVVCLLVLQPSLFLVLFPSLFFAWTGFSNSGCYLPNCFFFLLSFPFPLPIYPP